VTILFCDVTGSTALGERLDSESLRRVMERYFALARNVLERHGGTVEKFIGDAVMAVFGIPTVHEDDALRAARAAHELRDELGGLNADLQREFGTELQVRMGVNTGEVVTSESGTLATGDAVNVAARLEQAAEPGDILIGDATRQLAESALELERAEPVEAKGKSVPLVAYRLLGVRADAPGFERRFDAPFVGRGGELEQLVQAYARAVRDSSCQLFTVLGPPGSANRASFSSSSIRSVTRSFCAGAASPTGTGSRTSRSWRSSSRSRPTPSSAGSSRTTRRHAVWSTPCRPRSAWRTRRSSRAKTRSAPCEDSWRRSPAAVR